MKIGYLNILSEPLELRFNSKNQPNRGPIQLVKELTLFFKNRENGAIMTNAPHMLLVNNYEVYYIYYRFMSVLIFQLILSHLSQFIKFY